MAGKKTERGKIYQPKNTLSRGYTASQSSFKWQKNCTGTNPGGSAVAKKFYRRNFLPEKSFLRFL